MQILTTPTEFEVFAEAVQMGVTYRECGKIAVEQSLYQHATSEYHRLCGIAGARDLTDTEIERLHHTALYLAGGTYV